MKNLNEFHANKIKTMLVDGDLLAYKITSALEETIQWEDDVWTLHCDLDKCKQFWKQSIAYYMKHTNSANAPFLSTPKFTVSGSRCNLPALAFLLLLPTI